MMTELEEYYNKFYEEKRLTTRHGQVEYVTSMKYIHECIQQRLKTSKESNLTLIDIGAGTGRYSVALANEGYDVTAVELVKHNLGILKAKNSAVKAYQGNALKLSRFENDSFDITLLFGPMYHLYTVEDKVKALNEAKRITKPGGYILVAYCMNEYGVLTYGFKEENVLDCIADGRLNKEFHCVSQPKDLYDYVRIEDINELNDTAGLKRIKIISPDGPANYMRPVLNKMDEETFKTFLQYHLSTCERPDLIGAGAHTLDILTKKDC
jgi:ubiquinone/menaquinone biosynthesis C-methylase UbiE